MLTQVALDCFFGEQTQAPACVTFRRITTRKRGDLGAVSAVNLNGTTRAWSVVQTAQASGRVGITPSRNRGVMHLEGGGNIVERLATVEFEQSGGTLELPGGKRAMRKQSFKCRAISVAQGNVLFVHVQSLSDIRGNVS